jgi:hypothetical protein
MEDQHQASSSAASADRLRGTAEAGFRRLKEDARQGGEKAKERIGDLADAQKDQVSESLGQFATAIKKASEELRSSDQTLAAQLVREAADALGSLSRSIGGATPSELVGSVRSFGRNNPVAFIGGAVLAGLALGRFARAEPPRPEAASGRGPASERASAYPSQSTSPAAHRGYSTGSPTSTGPTSAGQGLSGSRASGQAASPLGGLSREGGGTHDSDQGSERGTS